MLKNQKGISMVVLLIGVLILVAIIAIGGYFLNEEVVKKDIETIDTDMLRVQAKSKVVAEKNIVNSEENPLRGSVIEDSEFKQKVGVEEETKLYLWDREVLDEQGLTDVKLEEGQFFAVDYKDEVFYSAGYKTKEGNLIYKLSDIKKLLTQKEE